MGQPGMVRNSARGQLNMENVFPPVHVHAWAFDIARQFRPSCPASVSSFYTFRLNLVLTHGIPTAFRDCVHYLYRQPPSGEARVYQVTQLRTDGVHCRESAGTGPAALKVVPVTGVAFVCHHGPNNARLSFPTLTIGTYSGHVRYRYK